MRLGKVFLDNSYVVDLDNEAMVEEAKLALYEDMMTAIIHEEMPMWITVESDNTAHEGEIPDFLIELCCPEKMEG